MIKNIVFDMGKVIQDFDPMHAIRPFTDDPEDQELLCTTIFRSQEWADLDRGTTDFVQAEAAWRDRLPSRLWDILAKIVDQWHVYMPYYPDMVDLIRELKAKGYALYLLSNAATRFYDYQNRCEAFSLMNGIVISADEKTVKPEPQIYQVLLKRYHLTAEECFFIDDSPANIEAARQAGMKGFVFQGDSMALRALLREAGVNA